MDSKSSHDHKRDSGYMSLGGNEAMDVDEDLSSPRVSHDRTLIVSAGISLGSPRGQRRGRRRLNTTGARVTHTVRSSDGPPTAAISTTVVGNSSGASVRPSYSVNPGNNGDPHVIGVITVGDVEKEEFGGGQVEQNHEAVYGGKEPVQNKNKNDDQKWASPRHPNGVFQNPLPPDPPKPTVFQIFVKNLDGKTFTFNVRASDTVDSLHEQVRRRIGIPSEQCWINFEGRKLQLGKTLGEHGVYEHSTMFLQTRLRGALKQRQGIHLSIKYRATNMEVSMSKNLIEPLSNLQVKDGYPLNKGTFIVRASISHGHPRGNRRGRRGNTGTSVSHVVTSSGRSPNRPTIVRTTTAVGDSSRTSVRSSYSAQAGDSGDANILGVITVGDVEDDRQGGDHVDLDEKESTDDRQEGDHVDEKEINYKDDHTIYIYDSYNNNVSNNDGGWWCNIL